MGREVRRVNVNFKHPQIQEPYNRIHLSGPMFAHPKSRMLAPGMEFQPCFDETFDNALDDWLARREEWLNGTHSSLKFSLEYHAREGYLQHDGTRCTPVPIILSDGSEFWPTTIQDIVDTIPFEKYEGGPPDPDYYLPKFALTEPLGYALYETVSEGTPCTPVFATPEELIDHLVTYGEDYDQKPYRREAAEALVRGGWAPSVMTVRTAKGTQVWDSHDMDKMDQLKETS
jgi:hypothetical protein